MHVHTRMDRPRDRTLRRSSRRALGMLAGATLCAATLSLASAQGRLVPPVYYLVSTPVLQVGSSLQGALTASDGQNFKDGSRVDVVLMRGKAGDAVRLSAISSDFDTYLAVYAPDGRLVGSNDDAEDGSGTDAALDLTLPETGRYLVIVSGYEASDLGPYTLTLATASASGAQSAGRPIEVPTSLTSTLTADMPAVPDSAAGSAGPTGPSEAFVFDLNENALLLATMSSSDFDAELFLFDDGGSLVAMNDDADPVAATDATLAVELEPGRYRLVAASYDAAGFGDYALDARLFRPLE